MFAGNDIKKTQIILAFVLFTVFSGLTISFPFFHTEDSLNANKKICPACHFQTSALSILNIIIVLIINFVCLFFLKKDAIFPKSETLFLPSLSRSPPSF